MGRLIRHGMTNHPVWQAWHGMKERCNNSNNPGYKYYGGRGIKVCNRWLDSFENFRDDMLSTWQSGLQLNRINNDGNYEPSNCKWVTASMNMKNRRGRSKIQSRFEGISWNAKRQKWEITNIRPMFDSEDQACFIYTKLKEYEKYLIGEQFCSL